MGFASVARTIDFARTQLRNRQSTVEHTAHRDAVNDVKLFLEFIECEFLLKDIVAALPVGAVDLDEWRNNVRQRGHDLPPDFAQRAAKCLAILRHLSEESPHTVWGLATQFSGERYFDPAVRELLGSLARNLGDYLDEELHRKQVLATPEEILHDVAQMIGEGENMDAFPKTRATLGNASRVLAEATSPNDYQNVANTCRQALIEFGQELYRKEHRPDGQQTDPKKGNAVQRLSWTSRYLLRALGRRPRSKSAEVFDGLIKTTWELVSNLVHDAKASLDDARLCLMHTYLIVWRLSRAFVMASMHEREENDAG